MPRRCVFGCQPQDIITHKLPHPNRFPDQFKAWCKIITGNADFILDHNLIVCDRHFTESDRNRNHRLNALAVPTLFLPEDSCVSSETTTSKGSEQGFANYAVDMSTEAPHRSTSFQHLLSSHTDDLQSIEDVSSNVTIPCHDECNLLDDIQHQPSSVGSPLTTLSMVTKDHSYCISSTKITTRKAPVKTPMLSLGGYDGQVRGKIKNLKREVGRLRKRGQTFKTRLENAKSLYEKSVFQQLARKLPTAARIFTCMQLKFVNKKPKGRRFSVEEQILSLSLYKRSPKCYNFMYKMFALPSTKTLKRLLSQIKLKQGINKIVFEKLKKTVESLKPEDKLCSLIFDEMSIYPQIHYDSWKDEIKGLASHGTKNAIANHALVFMVKGLRKKFKQPVAYYFTNNLNKTELKKIIKSVLMEIQTTGLIVMCTVCDQSTVNVSAINELVTETKISFMRKGIEMRNEYFTVNKKNIIPLYDTPHLLKGLRNNLLTKNLIYTDDNDNKEKIIKWKYFEMLYAADKSSGELRCLPKLTEEHVIPDKIKKMRVKTAAQIFSHSVAVATLTLLRNGNLPQECHALIPIVSLIDDLFDSLNVSSLRKEDGKKYKWPIRKNSDHHQLWQRAIKVLKTVKFVTIKKDNDKTRLVESVVPTIKNFIKTIEGFKFLWKTLSEKYSFDCMLTRHFNQDPVENFFGNIRSYGARNIAPNCVAFEGAYKSLLLNNYNSPQSLQANCEEDNNDCLNNLDFFLKDKNSIASDIPEENDTVELQREIILNEKCNSDQGQRNYVCGWVLRKCLQKICRSCDICKLNLISNEETSDNEFIRAKEYYRHKNWLCYPSTGLSKCFEQIQSICVSHLKGNVRQKGTKNTIKIFNDIFVTFPFICETHKDNLKKYFENTAIDIIIYSWCRSINRILSGKLTYEDGGDDEMKIIAQKYYNKHCKRRK